MTFTKSLKVALLGIVLVGSSFANAAQSSTQQKEGFFDELRVVGAALQGQSDFIQAIENRDFTTVAHRAMDNAVRGLEATLRERSEGALADELIFNWEGTQTLVFAAPFMKDLGDHAPLFQWMEDFFMKIEDRLGTAVFNSLPYIGDLRTLNFAIPVVFQPRGSWQADQENARIEYRKHFIPFANIVTYYVSYFGCLYFVKQQGMSSQFNKLCAKAADKLKFVMGRYIAAPVSDFLFNSMNNNYRVRDDQIQYKTPEELRNAVQGVN